MITAARLPIRCVVGTALMTAVGVTLAAETATPVPVTLEEVVVTAQKREERLMDVPAAITTVGASELTEQNLVQIQEYYSRIPALQFACKATYCLSLRGVTTGGASNPTLAILIDDIQFGSTTVSGLGNGRFPDIDPSMLERLEVLRGPQGTLYGAASLGGLIKFVTRQPQTDQFSSRVEAGMESVHDGSTGWTSRGAMNLPISADRAALSVSGFIREDAPYLDNVRAGFVGSDVNETRTYGGHAAFLLKPTDNATITLSALKQKRDADYSPSMEVLTGANGVPTFVPRYGENNISLATTSDTGEHELYSGRVELDLGGVQLTSLTAWSNSEAIILQDLSNIFGFLRFFYGAPVGSVINIDDIAETRKFSQELRLSGSVGQFDWRAGGFYTKETSGVDQTLTLFSPTGSVLAVPYVGKGPATYKERAVFADGVYHLTPKLDLQAGVRYATNDQTFGSSTTIDGPAQAAFGPSSALPDASSSDSSLTWAVSPTYHFNPDFMGYVRVATGYRPGGANTTVGNIPGTYDPDKVVNYELGVKGFALDRSVSFDVAAFQIDWRDIQLQNTDSATQFTYFTNGGKARSRGLEATVRWLPLAGLTIDANATVLDAELKEPLPTLVGADSLVGASGDRLPASSRFSGNLGIQKEFQLASSLTAFVGGNWSYVGTRRSDFLNTAATLPRFELPSYSVVDLRVGISTASDWRLALFARNVLDEDGIRIANNRNGTGVTNAWFLQPRTLGFTLSKDF